MLIHKDIKLLELNARLNAKRKKISSKYSIEYIEHDKLQMIILKVAYCIHLLTLNKSKNFCYV